MQPRSKKLARQFKKYLQHEDAEDIVKNALEQLKEISDDTLSQDFFEVIKNFENFIDIVDTSYAEYEDRLNIAARNIQLSSDELNTAYRELETLNISINAMLDSLGQGLLFFDQEGICSKVYSKSCLKLLDTEPAGKSLDKVLGFSPSQAEQFYAWLPLVFSGNTALDFTDMKQLLPSETVNKKGQIIELDYRPMLSYQEKLEGILLIATDVSKQRESDTKLLETQDNAYKIQQIAQNRNGFHHFLTDLYSFFNMIKSGAPAEISQDDRQSILREIHTFKGQASLFSLTAIVQKLHACEVDLAAIDNNGFIAALQEMLADLEDLTEKEKQFARQLFGPDFITQGRVRTIEVKKINRLTDLLAGHVKDGSVLETINRFINQEFLSIPVFESFIVFQREISRLAEQQGKPIPVFNISGDNVPVLMSSYERFFGALTHLARNIIDHGIEEPSERLKYGKPREGKVEIHIARIKTSDSDLLEIRISDDGKGIDPELIRQKLAEERDMDTGNLNDSEVLDFIFEPAFSLKSQVTLLSGQGVGMNALREQIHEHGGTVTVESDWKNHTGTTFLVRLPYSI